MVAGGFLYSFTRTFGLVLSKGHLRVAFGVCVRDNCHLSSDLFFVIWAKISADETIPNA